MRFGVEYGLLRPFRYISMLGIEKRNLLLPWGTYVWLRMKGVVAWQRGKEAAPPPGGDEMQCTVHTGTISPPLGYSSIVRHG